MSPGNGVKWLLIANVAVFLIYFFATLFGLGSLFAPFRLTPEDTV
jgi:hypothetical protein